MQIQCLCLKNRLAHCQVVLPAVGVEKAVVSVATPWVVVMEVMEVVIETAEVRVA